MPSLPRKLVKRAAMLLIVLTGVSLLSFALSAISPIDAAEAFARRSLISVSPEQIDLLRVEMGLDKPIYIQYLKWLGGLLRGDFGVSLITRAPIADDIFARISLTLKLSGLSLLIVAVTSVSGAVICAARKNSPFDHAIRGITVFGLSVPNFWLGFVLLLIFAVKLPIFNVIESGSSLKALILPAVALAIPSGSSMTRIFRATILSEMNKDYVIYARARGLSAHRTLWMHILKNSFPSILTMLCQNFGYMISSCAVLEKIFSLKGLGGYLADAIIGRDLAAVNACVFIVALIFVAVNTLSDIVNARIAPRMAGGVPNV
ncbi:MAG: ABC transporter permease [Oscillospiraceae bacterium]|nr:ABC transporter permease [Oscillospiraceae bacterium]